TGVREEGTARGSLAYKYPSAKGWRRVSSFPPIWRGYPGRRGLRGDAAQAHVRVVLQRLADRPVGLRQRRLRGARRLGKRARERVHEELVRLRPERERPRLAPGTDH